jgi:aspartyl-tRNA(Asn)/glutamyl-tRNA(Gln) amidotransferase subunit C
VYTTALIRGGRIGGWSDFQVKRKDLLLLIINCQLSTINYHLLTKSMLDQEQVHKIAHLARLEITPEEEIQFAGELSSILDYFEQLSELDTTDVQPTTRAIELNNITRPDVRVLYDHREDLLKQAPEPEGDFFRVPQILSSDED